MDLEQTVRAAFELREPRPDFEDVVMARLSAGAWRAEQRRRRRPGRTILIGVVLVVAAAAALLTLRPWDSPLAAAVVPAPLPEAKLSEPALAAGPSAVAEPGAPIEDEAEPKEAAVAPFIVSAQPLRNEVKDAASREAVVTMYAAFLDRLRAVPGLTLIEPHQAGSGAGTQVDYRITISSRSFGASDQFGGELHIETLSSDGTVRSETYTSYPGPCTSGSPVKSVDADTTACMDAQGVATELVADLRTTEFPPDRSWRRHLRSQLVDRSMDANQRLQALRYLASMGRFRPGNARAAHNQAGLEALRDPVVVRGAIDLAATAADTTLRTRVWVAMRGVASAELVGPLLGALRRDADGEVRLAALGTLAADFREDARVRQGLETAAQRDARPLVRAVARRNLDGVGGDVAWRDYIIASLKDTQRSAVERIEALFYHMDLPVAQGTQGYGARMRTPGNVLLLLDDEALHALDGALTEVAQGSTIAQWSAQQLGNDLAHIAHPAITDMLLASLDEGRPWPYRETVVRALAESSGRRNDSRVRAALEKVSMSDPDPELRQIAAASLQKDSGADAVAANATSANRPPRLGIDTAVLEPGPYVPKELVGKLVIESVGPGSVGRSAGLLEGDVLLEVNGAAVLSGPELIRILDSAPRGVDVDVLVSRFGETVTLKARF